MPHPAKHTAKSERGWVRFAEATAEAILGLVLGIALYFLPGGKGEIAGLVLLALGPSLSLGRFLYARTIAKELQPVQRMTEILDLGDELRITEFREMAQAYLRITEQEFKPLRDVITSDAKEKLRKLAEEKVTEELPTGEYYGWLLPMLKHAQPGSSIWAVSMMLSTEWDDSPPEEEFLRLNLDAAKRGVTVERIFVVPKALIPKMATNKAVSAHIEKSGGRLQPWLVEREHLRSRDSALLKKLGDGIIAFDRRVVLIDISAEDGMRGQVTMNPTEVDGWRRSFDALRQHARPLSMESLKRWTSAKT